MQTRISILGCGWLGMPLAAQLAEAGYPVNGATTRAEKMAQITAQGATPFVIKLTPDVEGDIASFLAANILFINVPPSRSGDGQPLFYLRQMQALIPHIEASSISKVIFISATSVYPANNSEVKEEDAVHMLSPHSDTAWLEIENLFRQNSNFSTTILRFSGLIGGSYQPGRYFSGREMGDADGPVNMIHRSDCINIVMQIIQQDLFGDTFNACADEHPSRREFYTKSCELLSIAPPTFTDTTMPYRIVNCDKLKQRLGYQFIYPNPLLALGVE